MCSSIYFHLNFDIQPCMDSEDALLTIGYGETGGLFQSTHATSDVIISNHVISVALKKANGRQVYHTLIE